MLDERADERFDPLIGDERDLDLRLRPALIGDDDFAEVVLRKLARQSLESDQWGDHARTQRLREGRQCRLPTRVARHAGAMQELDRQCRVDVSGRDAEAAVKRRSCFGISTGSNEPWRSRGTDPLAA
jgi:hypothetical protein